MERDLIEFSGIESNGQQMGENRTCIHESAASGGPENVTGKSLETEAGDAYDDDCAYDYGEVAPSTLCDISDDEEDDDYFDDDDDEDDDDDDDDDFFDDDDDDDLDDDFEEDDDDDFEDDED
jgi:hypothetical protein